MSDAQNSSPAAGWYPDPAGGTLQRYWDGGGWTERTYDPATAPSSPARPPRVADGVSGSTPFNWALSLLPLLGFLQSAIIDYRQYFADALLVQTTPGNFFASPGDVSTQLTLNLFSFAIYAVSVLLAFFDWRMLRARGFVQPFHWAWTFLSAIPYVIGRAVVVNRRGAPAFAPMWTYIALNVLSVIVGIVLVVGAVSAVFQSGILLG